MDRTVPGYYDMGNNTSELLSTTRSLIRHPLTFWRGQYTYPYEYNNALINSNYLIGFPYYLIFKITDNACLAYNGILILIFFLNAFAIYLLINYWTGSWLSAIFAGIICAFFPHRFHDLVDYHYQITFIPPLALYAWLLFLRKDKLQYLILFFFFIGIKAVTLDYITIYLLAFLIIIIPAGFITYPERLKKYWWQFLVCSSILLIIIIPFYIPYWINQNKLPHIGWIAKIAGTTRVELLDWNHLVELFKNFFYNITHLRQRCSYIPDAPILPGVVPIFLSAVSILWIIFSSPFKGKKAFLRIAMLLTLAIAVFITFTPIIKRGDDFVCFAPLAFLHLDPPILGFIRNSRAYIHTVMLCLSILVGLSLGDLFAFLKPRNKWIYYSAIFVTGVLMILTTLEYTVKTDRFTKLIPPRPTGFYAWLANQKKPSPFIEFPFSRNMHNFIQVANGIIADQPTGVVIGRCWPQMSYFMMDIGNVLFSEKKLRFLEASPYKFWIQKKYNNNYRKKVEAQSSIKYATNFGSTYIFENPEIERSFPIDISITQKWSLSLPYVYTVFIDVNFTSQFTFVKLKERRLNIYCDFLDKNKKTIKRLKIKGDLPFMLEGPKYSCSIHFKYNPNEKILKGYLRNSGHFNMEKQPIDSVKCGAEIFDTKTININLLQPATGKTVSKTIKISKTPKRWPLKFNAPNCIPNLAGGFSPKKIINGRNCRMSIGKNSAIYNGSPPVGTTEIIITAKSAIENPPEPLSVILIINDKFQSNFILSNEWTEYTFPVPTNIWKKINKFVFKYPKTYFPCLLNERYDDERRCAIFSEMSAVAATQSPTSKRKKFGYISFNNLISDDKWNPWRNATIYTNQLKFDACPANAGVDCKNTPAPFKKGGFTIENPQAELIGVSQTIPVYSGKVYKITGEARSIENNNEILFGGRIGFYIKGQKEKQIVWMMENNIWIEKSLTFTNSISGTATLFVHLGYGNVSQTGEFKNITFKELKWTEIKPPELIAPDFDNFSLSNIIYKINGDKTNTFNSVFDAFDKCKNNDKIIIYPGYYYENNRGSDWMISNKKNVGIIGKGNPWIIVRADKPGYRQISMQLPYNENLSVEGITLKTISNVITNNKIYGSVFTGCKNVVISNCVFWTELHATNSVAKNVVAVNGATNVVICGGMVVTRDITGKNEVSHFASHDAAPIELRNVKIYGENVDHFSIGKIKK